MIRWICALAMMLLAHQFANAATEKALPEGYWSGDKARAILDKTLPIHLAPDLSGLNQAERETVDLLLQVGDILHDLYIDSRHSKATAARKALNEWHERLGTPARTRDLQKLFRMFKGPIATNLENQRVSFLPVSLQTPAVYPPNLKKDAFTAYLEASPDRRAMLMDLRSVVREATESNLKADLEILQRYPDVSALHPSLRKRLQNYLTQPGGYYAVPYALAYAEALHQVHELLWRASIRIAAHDPDFSKYLANRARDMITNDYESGDAAWVTGRFGKLNAQIGAYETYDDTTMGVRAFFGLSLLLRDEARTTKLRKAIQGIQEIEQALPFPHAKRVREDIPVGVYQIIADFGQARGTNTATILPNESYLTRKYGRTILLRHNILAHPKIYEIAANSWRAGVLDKHAEDLTLEGNFNRTLWHEIGHYLGPGRDKQGRTLNEALAGRADLMEELKADLVSLFAAGKLAEKGVLNERELRSIYAAGIYRTFQRVRPRNNQPYQSMQLMQMNYFLGNRLLTFRPGGGQRMEINYERYAEVITKMLKLVLDLQYQGDATAVENFVTAHTIWHAWLHERLAQNLREAVNYRYRLVTYAALNETPE